MYATQYNLQQICILKLELCDVVEGTNYVKDGIAKNLLPTIAVVLKETDIYGCSKGHECEMFIQNFNYYQNIPCRGFQQDIFRIKLCVEENTHICSHKE